MQCSSFIPVYHARDFNVGTSVFSWYAFDSNADSGEERSYDITMRPYNMDIYVGCDKEVLKKIIQNHEATFRYQVQELHRLYQRQREMMDEMRVREIFAQHLLSQTSKSIHLPLAWPEFSQTTSHALSWLLGDDIQRPSKFVAEKYQESTSVWQDSFIKTESFNDVKCLSLSSKGSESRNVDLELPPHMYCDDRVKQFKEGHLSEAPSDLPNFQHSGDLDIGSVKAGDMPSFDLESRKRNCLFDLNEPVQIESLPSSSLSPKTCHMEIMNSSVAIDLNSLHVSCFSETEMTPEKFQSMSKETIVVLDHSSACDHAMKNEIRVETKDSPVEHDMNDKFLKTAIKIDLNTAIVDKYSLPLSSSVLLIKSAEDVELVDPVSPENDERSPPRLIAEDFKMGTPLLSEQREEEPSMEVDTIAAQTLVTISFRVQEYNSEDPLCWFARIVSSTEDEIMKLENCAAYDDQGKANALEHSEKKKETGILPGGRGNGRKRGTKRREEFQSEGLPSLISFSEYLHGTEEFMGAGPLRQACAKPRKYSKLSSQDAVKKLMSSIQKQHVTRSSRGVLQSWGKMRKRQVGRRRRRRRSAGKYLLIS